jgi:hypothetical protein
LGYSKRHTLRIIQDLIDTGIIKRVARGKYTWGNRKARQEKQKITESRQITLPQAIEFIKEKNARVVHDTGTLVIEYEDDYAIRRVIINSIVVEDSRVVEQLAGRTTVYKIPRIKLRQLLTT